DVAAVGADRRDVGAVGGPGDRGGGVAVPGDVARAGLGGLDEGEGEVLVARRGGERRGAVAVVALEVGGEDVLGQVAGGGRRGRGTAGGDGGRGEQHRPEDPGPAHRGSPPILVRKAY